MRRLYLSIALTRLLAGIVIKYENISYKTAVHYAHLILSLTSKASKYVRDLFEPPDVGVCGCIFIIVLDLCPQNEVESIRIRTAENEMIISQHGNFTFVVNQTPHKVEQAKVAMEEKKEGEGEAKKAEA